MPKIGSKNDTITIRISHELKHKLTINAKRSGETLSEYVNLILLKRINGIEKYQRIKAEAKCE
jgi:predicted DNA-binding protein